MVKVPERRNMPAPKAIICIMIGYKENIKAYKLYDVENNCTTHGVHVKIMETEFFSEPDLPDSLENDDSDGDTPPWPTTQPTTPQSIVQSALRHATNTINTVRSAIDSAVETLMPPATPTTARRANTANTPDPDRDYGAPLNPAADYPWMTPSPNRSFAESQATFKNNTRSHFKNLRSIQDRANDAIRMGNMYPPDNNNTPAETPTTGSPASQAPRISSRLHKRNPKYAVFSSLQPLDTPLKGY
ncbi:hypothetical protein B5M09_010423 [Aphanomyces astaci]|uniref:Retroviral polymerase SH3-like domain-containing protein n=1 Tax=Aphanomyces astaci TaxID=112090 RepID=A0A425C1F6_APHAT|nr:hypothetical protein B5M09_010423 [Aphanomyces astaci]